MIQLLICLYSLILKLYHLTNMIQLLICLDSLILTQILQFYWLWFYWNELEYNQLMLI